MKQVAISVKTQRWARPSKDYNKKNDIERFKMNNMYVCDYCGKQFIPHGSTIAKLKRGEQKTLTCSMECCTALRKKTVETQCDNCGAKLIRKKSHYDRQVKLGQHQYCSLKCQKEFMHKQTYEFRKCEICGSEYECPKISTQRFCSPSCQGKWQSTMTGTLNARFTQVQHNCDYCGKLYYMKKYKTNQEHNFCSFECQRKWFCEFYIQTDEFKQASRERAIEMLENGKMPVVYTKPQLIINNILDELNIQYVNNYGIKYYSVDNYLLQYNLMIEVMGDYWHSNPLKFSYEKLNDIQLSRIPRDKAKHTYVVNQYNIEILYLWEYDILNNPLLCKQLIIQYVNNKGILKNYQSFNYSYDDKLILNNDIVVPYQDMQCKPEIIKVS